MQPNLTNFEFFFEILLKFYSKNTAPTRPENVRMGVTGVKADFALRGKARCRPRAEGAHGALFSKRLLLLTFSLVFRQRFLFFK